MLVRNTIKNASINVGLQYLTFKTQEIPEGRSELHLDLTSDVVEEGDPRLISGEATLHFFKTAFFVEIEFELNALLELQCDRSLDLFEYPVQTRYKVVFKADASDIADDRMAERTFASQGEELDITTDIRDSILLALPIKPIHPRFTDDEGNPVDFETQKFGFLNESETEHEIIDPRWSKLKELKEQFSHSSSSQ